jgi:polo-like kinase 1
LLQHFRNYLKSDSKDDTYPSIASERKDGAPCYVKKWMKTRHAIMFRLNNKIVQVDFTDKTVIVLSSEQKLVTYINAKGEKS